MAVDVSVGELGSGLFERLGAAVDAHKRTDPLAPVTVVVSANSVGVAARRFLARRGGGIAGASFVTPYRLAELLAGADLAASGRRPISTPVVAAASRRALAGTRTRFAAVAGHPATELAVVKAFHELDVLDPDELATLSARGERARDVVTLFRAVRSAIERDFHTERDLLEAAARRVGATGVPADFGAVVVFDPERIARPAIRMLRAIAERTSLAVVIGLSGSDELDLPSRELVAALDGATTATVGPADRQVDHIVSVSDPDEEARAVVRQIVATARAGTPLERMAVVFGARDPYARLLHEHLAAAGIPHNGLSVRTLADSVAGRTLTRALALGDHDLRRDAVLAYATAAPVQHRGRVARTTAWERVSRQAGVVAGLDQWRERLGRHAHANARRPDTVRDCEALLEFVESIAATLARAGAARTWSSLATIARELLRRSLPGDRAREQWSADEQRAYERVQHAVDRLATLDPVEPNPDLATFRHALAAELDADLGRVGRIGEGVLVGPLDLVLGVETDALFVVGVAEGSFPARHHDDSLLPDADRVAVGTEVLADRRRRARAEHRRLLAVLAMCRGERWFFHPRGDLRRTTDRPLSRYALDAVEARHGLRPDADELVESTIDGIDIVPSYAAGIARTPTPATEQDARMQAMLRAGVLPHELLREPVVATDEALRRAVELLTARGSDAFTRFDGNLAGCAVPSPADATRPIGITRLEAYSHNPQAYLFERVLGVELVEDPEKVERMTPIEVGNLLHEVLERFIVWVLDERGAKPPDEPWSPDERARLHAIADDVVAEYAGRGLVGRELYQRQDRRRLARDLDEFLARDDEFRRTNRCTPIAAELAFGFGEHQAVEWPLDDARTLRFSGSADRVDRTADGGYWVVDYKSGRSSYYLELSEDNPDAGGTRLQLPVYAHAVRTLRGEPDAPVTAAYRFVTHRGDYRTIPVPLTPTVRDRIDTVLRTVCDLIGRGVFPNPVEPPDSRGLVRATATDPDGRGAAELARQWARKQHDPQLAEWVAFYCEAIEAESEVGA